MPAENDFDRFQNQLNSPARRAVAITPSDADELPFVTRWIYVGTAGNLTVVLVDGDQVTFSNVPAGSWMYLMARQVRATATTAANLIAMA
jgi:hypothetical protein